MGNSVFPTLAGLAWDTKLAPQFNTKVHRAESGYEVRAAKMVYPLWTFGMKYELLRDDVTHNELRTLLGFFNARQGMFDSFLYSNPSDNSVSLQQIALGDGSTKTFQLTRAFGAFIEPVMNVNGSPSIYINGALQSSGYTISSTGLLTFTAAPSVGAVIAWTGAFYYRCRFLSDIAESNQFMKDLFNLSKLEFIGSPMNKV